MNTPENRLEEHIRDCGLRSSQQRNIILSVMGKEKKHYTVEEIHEIVKKTDSGVGIATVYRNIRLFCEAGIAREIHLSNDVTRYELVTDSAHHDHLICIDCGIFVEVSSDIIEKEQSRIAGLNGFELTSHNLVLYGVCKECRNGKHAPAATGGR